jgi:hypothetical protein
MGLRNFFRNPFRRGTRIQSVDKRDGVINLRCERRVNYDGTKVEVSGINFKGFNLGKIGVEKKILQTASHALMILDFEAYDLCMSVNGAPDKETQAYYYKRMMDDKLRSSSIYKVLAALSMDPESKELKVSLTESVAICRNRALEIEKSKNIEKSKDRVSDNSIEIGNLPLEKRLDDLRDQYYVGSDIVAKAKFYYAVIQKLDKMLGNPAFIKIMHGEDKEKVHDTLLEIDTLIEKNIVEPEITKMYREFRGPWSEFYTDDPIRRGEFALRVRDFRNRLVNEYNDNILPVYNQKAADKLHIIETDNKEYKILQ